MASILTLERRNTLYKLHRAAVRSDLRLARVLDHLHLADVTDDEVDAVSDQD